jgi:TorA maturation chaperone TorD
MSAKPLEVVRDETPAPEDLARADLYALLASLFYEAPGRDLLDTVARTPLLGEGAEGEIRDTWRALQAACASVDPEAVRQEFDTLFVGVGNAPVKPYASYYLAGFMNELPLAELRDELALLGFARRPAVAVTEDHLSALSDVMRMMILGAGEQGAADLAAQLRFFARYIKPWYGCLAEDLAAIEGAGFYKIAGRFAKAFLDVESESFEIA